MYVSSGGILQLNFEVGRYPQPIELKFGNTIIWYHGAGLMMEPEGGLRNSVINKTIVPNLGSSESSW